MQCLLSKACCFNACPCSSGVKVHMLSPPKHWLFGQYFHRTSYVDAESATEF